MTSKRTIRQMAVALLLLVAFLFQGTWALAGTTGGLGGYVTDSNGKAIAGASIKVVSASQAATATTDASGHFTFLALAPDTYTVSIQKDGFAPLSESGISVFADNQLALTFQLQQQLKTIASVTSSAAGALVKSGVGSDIYNVNSASIQASAALGGGTNLNSAYSAMSSVPGVNVPIGGSGWESNSASIRGSTSYFTGYEYDGVPVNRAFDNYNASTESNLGLQELQVYTGGGPASNSSSGTSGFINQVIKTGTYPGYANVSGGLGSDAFYHQLKVEAGGASPDRNFSYYVGLSGYNQAFRVLDNDNGASLMGPNGIYSDYSQATNELPWDLGIPAYEEPSCNADGTTPTSVVNALAAAPANPVLGTITNACIFPYTGLSGNQSFIADRENVVNFHFGIPRKDGQRDDLQLMWSGSMLQTWYYGSPDDVGLNDYMIAQTGLPYSGPTASNPSCLSLYFGGTNNCPGYTDGYVFNAPFGTPASQLTPEAYYQPDSLTDRAMYGELPGNQQDSIYNDQGIVKLQYTHALGSNAYARVFAYTFYSDWMQTGDNSTAAYLIGYPDESVANNYLLSTHTSGGEFQFSDQINDKNLLQFTANYTTANVLRDNNETNILAYEGAASPVGLISKNAQGQYTCWSQATTAASPGTDSPVPCANYGLTTAGEIADGDSFANYAAGPNATAAGAQLEYLWNGSNYGSYNQVQPNFANLSLSDQFRPNDRLLFDAAVRYENYTYNMPNSDTPANEFYAQAAANDFCYNTQTGQVYSAPLKPGQPPPASPIETLGDCNSYISGIIGSPVTGYVHPNGTVQDGVQAPSFSVDSPPSYTLGYWSTRFSGTYTQSPDTVWRFSAGRYVEPPISASVQYTNIAGNNTALWANFMDLGFMSPFHNVPGMTSGQYDLSLERHIRGTDLSYKVTPFYNGTNGYQEQSFIGAGFVTQVPVGRFRSYGVEAALTKGDFSKNGFSGQLAVTYTKAQVQYQSGLINNQGVNQISYYNEAICQYDALTSKGMPSTCSKYGLSSANNANYNCFNSSTVLSTGVGAPVGTAGVAQTCTGAQITNPYFNSPQQALLDPNGWYAPAEDVALPGVNTDLAMFDAPVVASLVANYRHNKWAVTPSLQFVTGSSYGTPLNTLGVDPRLCTAVDTTNTQVANSCAYTSLVGQAATPLGQLYVPDWQTGSFDSPGEYHNPNLVVGNIAFSYDISPRVTVNVTLANVFHTCFGGSKEPWTTAYPPGENVCAYGQSGGVSNFQLGNGYNNPGAGAASYSTSANGEGLASWQYQSYAPNTGSYAGFIPAPFNAYMSVNFKL